MGRVYLLNGNHLFLYVVSPDYTPFWIRIPETLPLDTVQIDLTKAPRTAQNNITISLSPTIFSKKREGG
jgi:hypothetical protein